MSMRSHWRRHRCADGDQCRSAYLPLQLEEAVTELRCARNLTRRVVGKLLFGKLKADQHLEAGSGNRRAHFGSR